MSFANVNAVPVGVMSCVLLALIYYFNKYSRDPITGKLTCENYVFNTQTYAAILATYTTLVTYIASRNKSLFTDLGLLVFGSVLGVLLFIIVQVGIHFLILYLPQEQQTAKYILSILYTTCWAFLLTVIIVLYQFDDMYVTTTLLMAIAVFVGLIIAGYKLKDYITKQIETTIVYICLAFLVASLIVLFIGNPSERTVYLLTLVGFAVVCVLLVLRTKTMLENEANCKVPDYPMEGTDFYAYLMRIFADLLMLRKKK
jgi:hypothetical protein